jgi:hypothetical protein
MCLSWLVAVVLGLEVTQMKPVRRRAAVVAVAAASLLLTGTDQLRYTSQGEMAERGLVELLMEGRPLHSAMAAVLSQRRMVELGHHYITAQVGQHLAALHLSTQVL